MLLIGDTSKKETIGKRDSIGKRPKKVEDKMLHLFLVLYTNSSAGKIWAYKVLLFTLYNNIVQILVMRVTY